MYEAIEMIVIQGDEGSSINAGTGLLNVQSTNTETSNAESEDIGVTPQESSP